MGEAYLVVWYRYKVKEAGMEVGLIPSGSPRWLDWAREIHALAQTGHHYAVNAYELQRAERLLDIAAEMINHSTGMQMEDIH